MKAVVHTTWCPYFEQLSGSESSIFVSCLLFSWPEGIFWISFPLKPFFFFPGNIDKVC